MEKKVQDQTSITDIVYIPKIEDYDILRQSDPRSINPLSKVTAAITNKEGRSPVNTADRKAPLQATRKGEIRK